MPDPPVFITSGIAGTIPLEYFVIWPPSLVGHGH